MGTRAVVFRTRDAWNQLWHAIGNAFDDKRKPVNPALVRRPELLDDGRLALALGTDTLALVRLDQSGVVDVEPNSTAQQPRSSPAAIVVRLEGGIDEMASDGTCIVRGSSGRHLYRALTNGKHALAGPDWFHHAPCCFRSKVE
jgi:hypothetical protein